MKVWRKKTVLSPRKLVSSLAVILLFSLSMAPSFGSSASASTSGTTGAVFQSNPEETCQIAKGTSTFLPAPIIVSASREGGSSPLILKWTFPGSVPSHLDKWCVHLLGETSEHPDLWATCPSPTHITPGDWECSVSAFPSTSSPDYYSKVEVRAHTSDRPVYSWSSSESIITTTTQTSGGVKTTRQSPSNGGALNDHSRYLLIIAAIEALALIVLVVIIMRRNGIRRRREAFNAGGGLVGETPDLSGRTGRSSVRGSKRGVGAAPGMQDERHFLLDDRPTPIPVDVPGMVFLSAEVTPDLGGSGALRVHPQMTKRGVTWATPPGPVLGAGLWSEKRAEHGEDAEPYFRYQRDAGRTMVAVFDGMGGAGGAISRQTRRGAVTQAYDASRLARLAAERWFATLPTGPIDATRAALGLHDELFRVLADRSASLEGRASGLVGTMKRTFPTTLAAVVTENGGDGMKVLALWSGDSRSYILTPSRGLQQISRDDTAIQDALAALLADPPIDNVICADRPFVINQAEVVETEPFVVLVASDGCFGYVPTPPLFEVQILRTLTSADTPVGWMQDLLDLFEVQAQDDTSLSAAAIGFADFDAVRRAFAPRAQRVEEEFGVPYDRLANVDDGTREQFEKFRSEAWDRYRPTYEARMTEQVTTS